MTYFARDPRSASLFDAKFFLYPNRLSLAEHRALRKQRRLLVVQTVQSSPSLASAARGLGLSRERVRQEGLDNFARYRPAVNQRRP